MISTDLMLFVSLLLLLVGIVLMVRQVGRRMREIARGERRVVEETADLACQTIFIGALALMQFSTLVADFGKGTLPLHPWLSLTANTLTLLLFGASLGRLLLRWQLRHILADLDRRTKPLSKLA